MGTGTVARGRGDGVANACWWLGLSLYLAAFALPYYGEMWGFHVFYLGLLYCWLPLGGFPCWWANPLFWSALASFTVSPGRSLVAAVAATALGVGWAFACGEVPGPAYWAWVAGMGVVAVGAAYRARGRRAAPPAAEPEDW